ncbi:Ribonuclease BN [Paraburkholderia caffeinitolerans]|uniref:Ribonuclease BN n=1 Tax=Paraburkholderia caffeinitolerans TaxID=1723730 RepID=A0A6J5GS56_9BURK|nr:MBL fold metallo-hydrolase [Paraburkholderia caffeinitolerans]CAB3803704.1 Ribonuclease BN [Paraburkholderia caffeinitolerans]
MQTYLNPMDKARRNLLIGASSLALGVAVGGHSTANAESVAPSTTRARTRLVLLGVGGGRTSWRGCGCGGISSAVVVGDDVYLVDFGRGWLDAYFACGLGSPGAATLPGGLDTLRTAFITHLHADHVVDYSELLLFGATDGVPRRKSPVQIYGPGSVPAAQTAFYADRQRSELISPDRPQPGTRDMTEALYRGFASDLNDNITDSGMPNPHRYIDVHDIVLPEGLNASFANPAPGMRPFPIYRDENVLVSAILVNHRPMFPAFAFRFESADGVIVFSGDTTKCDNLVELAKGADILVHEAIDLDWATSLFPQPLSLAHAAKLRHLKQGHTEATKLGEIASAAEVKTLVLSHLAPPTLPESKWLSQIHGFDGRIVVGKPHLMIGL